VQSGSTFLNESCHAVLMNVNPSLSVLKCQLHAPWTVLWIVSLHLVWTRLNRVISESGLMISLRYRSMAQVIESISSASLTWSERVHHMSQAQRLRTYALEIEQLSTRISSSPRFVWSIPSPQGSVASVIIALTTEVVVSYTVTAWSTYMTVLLNVARVGSCLLALRSVYIAWNGVTNLQRLHQHLRFLQEQIHL